MNDVVLLAGTASRALAWRVASELGVGVGAAEVERFPDGETSLVVAEEVEGRDVFVIQATSPPVNDHLIELLAFADGCRRGGARRIVAVVPYFGYARSDRRDGGACPVMASLAAGLIEAAGFDRVVVVDAHIAQIEGFFRAPVDPVSAVPTLAAALTGRVPEDAVVVAPDLGAAERAAALAERLDLDFAVLQKRRRSGALVEIVHVFGDVRGRSCLLVDDMISTGGTIAEAVRALRDAGAEGEMVVAATHGVLTTPARSRLAGLGLREIVLTDTIPVDAETWPMVRVVSVAPLLADAVRRIAGEGS